jgi:hypothetical protein
MKIDRYGQAKILTPEEIQLLFSEGLVTARDVAGGDRARRAHRLWQCSERKLATTV